MRRFLQENQVLTLPFDIEGDEFATKLFPLFPKKVQCVSVSYKYTFIFRGRMPSAVVCFPRSYALVPSKKNVSYPNTIIDINFLRFSRQSDKDIF